MKGTSRAATLPLIAVLIVGCFDNQQSAEEIAGLRRSNATLKEKAAESERRRIAAEADAAQARAERDRMKASSSALIFAVGNEAKSRVGVSTAETAMPASGREHYAATVAASTPIAESNYYNSAGIIKTHCASEWPDNFHMRDFCEDQQRKGIATLQATSAPPGMSYGDFATARNHCAGEWPDNFHMRAFCENQQFEGWRKTRR